MTLRPYIPVVALIALQALAGCGMPAKSGVATDDDKVQARIAEREAGNAKLRKRVEDLSLGRAQLFPGGIMADARHMRPLPRQSAVVPMPVVSVPAARTNPATQQSQPMQLVLAASTVKADACVYKPVMSDADLDACR